MHYIPVGIAIATLNDIHIIKRLCINNDCYNTFIKIQTKFTLIRTCACGI